MSAHLKHAARLTLLALTLVALLLVGLSTLERTGAEPVTPLHGVELVKKSSAKKPKKPKPPQTQKHCTDGKGRDAEKSPSCRMS